jgi:C_GCAxxG_C_C family probable redox protein
MQKKSAVGEKAFKYHKLGFHCAEAVSKAIIEAYGNDHSLDIPKVATAFGGGVGRTKEDICGGLAGAFIALGFLFGRNEAKADWSEASDLAAKLRRRFIEEHGTTNCATLLNTFGPQENMMRCKQLSGEVAIMLGKIIDERNEVYR